MPTNDQIILRQLLTHRREELSQPISEADFFELFAAEQVLKDLDLTWEEIESGIVGDGGDGGIDGFFTLVNGVLIREDTDLSVFRGEVSIDLHIVQAKRTSGFSESAIQRLRSTTEDLLDLSRNLDSLDGVYNLSLTTSPLCL